jgi:hypothetical protein
MSPLIDPDPDQCLEALAAKAELRKRPWRPYFMFYGRVQGRRVFLRFVDRRFDIHLNGYGQGGYDFRVKP